MSRRNVHKLDLKLNLSPPPRGSRSRPRREDESPSPTSCVSMELNQQDLSSSSSPEETSMLLVGCPRCLMYVMHSEEDPRCPKCKSTVLLDVGDGGAPTAPPPPVARKTKKR